MKRSSRTRFLRPSLLRMSCLRASYNEGNQLCWKASGTPSSTDCDSPPSGADSYLYDENGNLTSGANRTYAYNVKNQTTSITPSGGSATSLSYLGQSQNELTGIGSTTIQNNALGVGRQTSGGVASYFVRDNGGMLIGENVGTARHYYIADNLGSIRGLTNSSGSLATTYRYEPYGKLASSTGSTSNPMKFTGGHDTGLGVYHFGARYYDPAVGRWAQQDPIDQAGDLREANRYSYAGMDPVNMVDPSGTHGAYIEGNIGPIGFGYSENADGTGEKWGPSVGGCPRKAKVCAKPSLKVGASAGIYSGEAGDEPGGGVGGCLFICAGYDRDKEFIIGVGPSIGLNLSF